MIPATKEKCKQFKEILLNRLRYHNYTAHQYQYLATHFQGDKGNTLYKAFQSL